MGVYVAVEYCRGGVNERWIPAWLPMLQRSLTACDDLDCRALWKGVCMKHASPPSTCTVKRAALPGAMASCASRRTATKPVTDTPAQRTMRNVMGGPMSAIWHKARWPVAALAEDDGAGGRDHRRDAEEA